MVRGPYYLGGSKFEAYDVCVLFCHIPAFKFNMLYTYLKDDRIGWQVSTLLNGELLHKQHLIFLQTHSTC